MYDAGGYVTESAVSHDLRSVAVTQLSLLPASSTSP